MIDAHSLAQHCLRRNAFIQTITDCENDLGMTAVSLWRRYASG